MWRKKKFIIAAVLAAVLLAGSIGGVALAQTGEEEEVLPADRYQALLDRVAAIYQEKTGEALDQQALKDALTRAGGEMQSEALRSRLQQRVERGELTQEQADEVYGWWQAKPDVPNGSGFRGHCGGFPRMGGMGGFGGWNGGSAGWMR